jgi:hypothetical protein
MTDHFPDATKKVLSPAAQAVLDAYRDLSWTPDEEDNGKYYKFCHKAGMAAALRAVADQVVPTDALYARSCCEFTGEGARAALLAIADELENS